tara:strand:- start:165 stop:404 length:240 start_codon:yes stop_codon:yes gene_type:complete
MKHLALYVTIFCLAFALSSLFPLLGLIIIPYILVVAYWQKEERKLNRRIVNTRVEMLKNELELEQNIAEIQAYLNRGTK